MAVRNILLYPSPTLSKKAESVESFDRSLAALVRDMFETMEAHDGVGLAAPQVGVSKRLFVLCEPESGRKLCAINPEITAEEGRETAEEGCLSIPEVYAPVARYARVHLHYTDEQGVAQELDAEGLLARIIQHENDHLNGTVFFDRLDVLTLDAKRREWNELRAQSAVAVETT